MDLSAFRVGGEFTYGGGRFRCTDVGTRVIVAIRVDEAQVSTLEPGGPLTTRVIPGAEADAMGWFRGPPYRVVERVFDEDDRAVCQPL